MKIADQLENFSDWFRGKRAIAFSLLYLQRLRERVSVERKSNKNPTIQQEIKPKASIQVEDLREPQRDPNPGSLWRSALQIQRAESEIVSSVQCMAFPKLKSLKSSQDFHPPDERSPVRERVSRLKNIPPLLKLDPFKDAEGVIRVGRRLANSSLPLEMKFPVILPRQSHVTTLIIRYFHEKVRH